MLRKLVKIIWRGANALSTLQWLWGLVPAGAAGLIVGVLAKSERLAPVTNGVLALATFALVYLIYVAWRIERAPRIPQNVLDQANLAAARHWFRPGSLTSTNGSSDLPARHVEILQKLAPLLARVQEQALRYAHRDFAEMSAARSRAEALVSEIPYDEGTSRTVRDFLQACAIAADRHDTAAEMRDARQDVARIAPGLFRQLHAGVPVNRAEVDLPKWTLADPTATRPTSEPTRQLPRWTDDNYSAEWDYLAQNRPVEKDTPVGEALAFIATGEWGREFDVALTAMFQLDAPDPFKEHRQRAFDGKLTVWGRFNRSDIYRPIPAEHWSDHRLDGTALLMNGHARTTGNDLPNYMDLMVSRAEVEREWPR